MDQLIKQALEQRATEATVPSDAWAKQRALLQQAGVVGAAVAVRRPWWRRLGVGFEAAMVAALMVGLVAAGVAYGPLGPEPGGGERDNGGQVADPPDSPPDLNPVVTPEPRVLTNEPPAGGWPLQGYLTQARAMEIGRQAILEHADVHGGSLTLTEISLEDGKWELKYKADWRTFTDSHGRPKQDPRRPEASAVVPVTEVAVTINDDEGQGKTFTIVSDPSQLTGLQLELEHYRGRIVSGGERTVLRLTNADGSREGRDLTVWVLSQALGKDGLHLSPTDDTLKLWHLIYGVGREIDVYGLTTAPGEVLAYGLAMKDRPGWDLAGNSLVQGVPLPDGAKVTTTYSPEGSGYGYAVEGYTPEKLRAWYEEQMPRYGWRLARITAGQPLRLRYENNAWQYAEVMIGAPGDTTMLTLGWGSTWLGNEDQAVKAVFRELGDDPTYRQFPRTPGSVQGSINIGGPAPGQTIPAAYETRVQQLSSGEWDVELVRIWAEGKYHRYRFQVTPEGGVHRLSELGERPPAIP